MELLRRLEARARETLPAAAYDYFAGGAGDEVTLAECEDAWRRVWLRPRVLAGAGPPETSVELLGRELGLPVLLAPVAAQRLAHPDGEVAAARAAGAANTVFCLSTRATADLAEVAAAATGPLWFQLYVEPDRARSERVLRRAAEHGYERVVLTADLPVAGRRERERAHGEIPLPQGVRLATHLGDERPDTSKPAVGGWDAALEWQDLAWVAQACGLEVVVKGVLTGEDAALAVDNGACAVIVSNHGARQLDGAVPSAAALPEVASAVAGRVPVLVDGGVRSGADVVRALALGADAVLVGRPYVWGLAAEGEAGVSAVLEALREDIARTLSLIGAHSPRDVRPEHVRPRSW
jgi:4-hydroxymandelate oxidase